MIDNCRAEPYDKSGTLPGAAGTIRCAGFRAEGQKIIGGIVLKQWLKDAVFYEIYPQSFYDTNGDGIGDLEGIIEKLDYIKELGCNALWINPCFDSPFKDAGYDVRDYKLIAPRYGTNADAKALFEAAHAKGIHVLLDLVPGHTSEEHAWFKESSKPEKNEYSDRYIWTDSCFSAGDGMPFIGGETDRNGTYILNFFKCQPALNYGYGKCREKWQMPTDAPGPRATVEAVKDVMRFWLDMGCDGFRVDMASSLVKNDTHHKKYTCAIWRDIAAMLDKEYPEAALLSEWNQPRQSLKNGFDMDFMLEWQGNGYSWLMRNYDGAIDSDPHNIGKAYFCADSGTGIDKFLDDWLPSYKATRKDGLYCLITCNHDTIRPSAGLTPDELKIAYAMLFTLPGAPFVYYGDEIGMQGYRDPFNRAYFDWNSTERRLRVPLTNLARLRRSCDAFDGGSMELVEASADVLHYRRVGKEQAAEIILNNGPHLIVRTAFGKQTEVNPGGFTILVEDNQPQHVGYFKYY